jgi:hypothetical protein
MYCPSNLHDDYSNHLDLDVMQHRWTSIYEKTKHRHLPYKISFSGGEVATNKHFLPLVEWLVQNYKNQIKQMLVTTNGSASIAYYTRLFQNVSNIAFSLHSEHVDEQHFFNNVISLHKSISTDNLHNRTTVKRHLHVNIMNEYWNQDRIQLYVSLLSKYNISHSVNQIDYKFQTRTIPIMKGNLNLEIT